MPEAKSRPGELLSFGGITSHLRRREDRWLICTRFCVPINKPREGKAASPKTLPPQSKTEAGAAR